MHYFYDVDNISKTEKNEKITIKEIKSGTKKCLGPKAQSVSLRNRKDKPSRQALLKLRQAPEKEEVVREEGLKCPSHCSSTSCSPGCACSPLPSRAWKPSL